MKKTKVLMDTPVTVEIVDVGSSDADIERVFSYIACMEERFSYFKENSEVSRINKGLLKEDDWSKEMKEIFELAEQTKKETGGYFDIKERTGKLDPSGVVKGWIIKNAADMLSDRGFENFYIEAGGDIQVRGKNGQKKLWRVGIKNPFDVKQIVKVVHLDQEGIATSGTYLRGQHIYNPRRMKEDIKDIVSVTVVGPDVCQADRFATAIFAMGREGIAFAENLKGFGAYIIDKDGTATMTSGFHKYTAESP